MKYVTIVLEKKEFHLAALIDVFPAESLQKCF